MCHADNPVPYGFDSEPGSPLARQIDMLCFLDINRLEPTNSILPDFPTFSLRNTSIQEVEELDTVHY